MKDLMLKQGQKLSILSTRQATVTFEIFFKAEKDIGKLIVGRRRRI